MLTLFVTSFFKGLSWIDSRGVGHSLLSKNLRKEINGRKRKMTERKRQKKSKKEDERK
jgi:hypothetical protein